MELLGPDTGRPVAILLSFRFFPSALGSRFQQEGEKVLHPFSEAIWLLGLDG